MLPKNSFSLKNKSLVSLLRIIVISLVCLIIILLYLPSNSTSQANTVKEQYEEDIEELKSQIENINVHLDGIADRTITLQQTLSNLDQQVSSLQAIINRTQTEINRLNTEIDQLNEDIETQRQLLARIINLLYKKSQASTFELMITSDNFSDYLDQQEYLDRIKRGIVDSVNRVRALQADLEAQKQAQQDLLDNQQAQQVVLNASRWEKQQLLTTTNNEEAQYQSQLAQLEAEQADLEAQLENYLNSLIKQTVNLGSVQAGDVIGTNGNTGWSTGPHLHLVIYSAENTNTKYDPAVFLRNNNLVWPMGGSGGWVSQGYHAGHRALDIAASEGVPIRAIADGTIVHRGCLFTEIPKYSTFGVIINHGDYFSLYIHLQAPDNEAFSQCNINRRNQYGTKSINYNLTE